MSGVLQCEAQSHFYPYEGRYHFIYQSLKLPAFGVLLYNTMDNLGMTLSLCAIPVLNVFIDMELNTCDETLVRTTFFIVL